MHSNFVAAAVPLLDGFIDGSCVAGPVAGLLSFNNLKYLKVSSFLIEIGRTSPYSDESCMITFYSGHYNPIVRVQFTIIPVQLLV